MPYDKYVTEFSDKNGDVYGTMDEEARAMNAPDFAQGTANAAGSYVIHEGGLYLLPSGHAAGATWANTAKTAVTVGGRLEELNNDIIISDEQPTAEGNKIWIVDEAEEEYTIPTMDDLDELKSEIDDIDNVIMTFPSNLESDDQDSDLDVVDINGNVLVRFSNGHIHTKDFDSDEINKATDNTTADFDLSDEYGNIILRLKDGHIKTGKFDSETDVRRWVGKKWTVIGDSLSNAYSRTAKHYHEYIAENTGITVVNLGQSEGGYYARPNDRTFRKQAEQIPLDSDVITIFGSGNDVQQIYNGTITLGNVTDTGTTTACGCINITINNIFARKPDASIGIVTPTPWYKSDISANWTPSNPGNILETYCEAIVEICRRRSIPCLDLYHMSNLHPENSAGRNAVYTRDSGNGIHPDENGHKLFVPRFRSFIETLLYY